MRTPGHDEELAAGFLVSEGVVRSPDAITGFVRPAASADRANIITATLRAGAEIKVSAAKRVGTITSSCGICGKNSIAAIRQNFAPIKSAKRRLHVETL